MKKGPPGAPKAQAAPPKMGTTPWRPAWLVGPSRRRRGGGHGPTPAVGPYLIIRHLDTADGERSRVGRIPGAGPGTARHKLQHKARPGVRIGDAVLGGGTKGQHQKGERGREAGAALGVAGGLGRAEALEHASHHQHGSLSGTCLLPMAGQAH